MWIRSTNYSRDRFVEKWMAEENRGKDQCELWVWSLEVEFCSWTVKRKKLMPHEMDIEKLRRVCKGPAHNSGIVGLHNCVNRVTIIPHAHH